MFNIEDYLKRFTLVVKDSSLKKEEIIKIVKKEIGVEIKKEDIEVRDSILFLNTKPIIKNEVFLKKKKIESILKDVGIVGIK